MRHSVDLQHAAEAGEMPGRLLGLSVGRLAVGDRRRVAAAPSWVIARIRLIGDRAWCGLVPGPAPAPPFRRAVRSRLVRPPDRWQDRSIRLILLIGAMQRGEFFVTRSQLGYGHKEHSA